MAHKKAALTKFIVDQNKIDADQLEKMTAGEIFNIIKCDGDPRTVAHQVVPQMTNDLFVVDERIRRDIAEMMNFSRNQGGAAESPRKSASEAVIIKDAIEQRADERRDQCGDFIESNFAKKINPIVWTNWTTEEYVQLAGQPGFAPFVGADLKGFYGVQTSADSGRPISKAERKQDAINLFSTFRNDLKVNQYGLYKTVIERHEGVDVSELLPDQKTFETLQQIEMTLAAQGGSDTNPSDEPGGEDEQA